MMMKSHIWESRLQDLSGLRHLYVLWRGKFSLDWL